MISTSKNIMGCKEILNNSNVGIIGDKNYVIYKSLISNHHSANFLIYH